MLVGLFYIHTIRVSIMTQANLGGREPAQAVKDGQQHTMLQILRYTITVQTDKRRRKPWITGEMLDTMKERRKWKTSCIPEGKKNYRRLNNELRRTTDKDKENWWKEQCEELEELEKKETTDLMYQKVKSLTHKKMRHTGTSKYRTGPAAHRTLVFSVFCLVGSSVEFRRTCETQQSNIRQIGQRVD